MKKAVRIISLMCLCVIVFALCGCGSNNDEAILENKKQQVEQSMMSFVYDLEKYRGLSDSQVQDYIETLEGYKKNKMITEEQAKMNEDIISQWHEIESQVGEFENYGEFEFDSAGKTYTATLNLKYSNRDVKLVYVISKTDFEVTGANVEMVYTFGEKMSKAGLNTLTGIGIVFIMLILMSLIIYAFNIIPYIQAKYKKSQEAKKIEITSFDEIKETDKESTDDSELIAVIAAAIAASQGCSTDDFIVRSIRRRK
ncbi:MAG: OadG family protein [Lachnospiraceae bacterium]|nr:OadG family protein [Lachnospiraceae bacterium]